MTVSNDDGYFRIKYSCRNTENIFLRLAMVGLWRADRLSLSLCHTLGNGYVIK